MVLLYFGHILTAFTDMLRSRSITAQLLLLDSLKIDYCIAYQNAALTHRVRVNVRVRVKVNDKVRV